MRGQSLRMGRRIGVIGAVEAIVVDRIARAAVEPMVDILAADRREQIVLAPALARVRQRHVEPDLQIVGRLPVDVDADLIGRDVAIVILDDLVDEAADIALIDGFAAGLDTVHDAAALDDLFDRSEEHTSELQSLMRISYAVFCLTKNNTAN